jgi:hypothetical protein
LLILKRFTVWLLETSLGALLLGLALTSIFGHDQNAFARGLGLFVSGIVLFSFTTGYLLTTVVARIVWKGQKLWSYSAIAAVLFLIHSEFFFVVSGGSTRSQKLLIQAVGACVVFACTFLGSVVPQKWVSKRSKLAGTAMAADR